VKPIEPSSNRMNILLLIAAAVFALCWITEGVSHNRDLDLLDHAIGKLVKQGGRITALEQALAEYHTPFIQELVRVCQEDPDCNEVHIPIGVYQLKGSIIVGSTPVMIAGGYVNDKGQSIGTIFHWVGSPNDSMIRVEEWTGNIGFRNMHFDSNGASVAIELEP